MVSDRMNSHVQQRTRTVRDPDFETIWAWVKRKWSQDPNRNKSTQTSAALTFLPHSLVRVCVWVGQTGKAKPSHSPTQRVHGEFSVKPHKAEEKSGKMEK